MKDAKRSSHTLKHRITMIIVYSDLLGALAQLYTSFPRSLNMPLFVRWLLKNVKNVKPKSGTLSKILTIALLLLRSYCLKSVNWEKSLRGASVLTAPKAMFFIHIRGRQSFMWSCLVTKEVSLHAITAESRCFREKRCIGDAPNCATMTSVTNVFML